MPRDCGSCKHGHDTKAGGGKPSPGTVWCSQRNIQMGKSRPMACFSPRAGERRAGRCLDCRRAKMLVPPGEPPRPGNVWCDKRHAEVNKLRSPECFE